MGTRRLLFAKKCRKISCKTRKKYLKASNLEVAAEVTASNVLFTSQSAVAVMLPLNSLSRYGTFRSPPPFSLPPLSVSSVHVTLSNHVVNYCLKSASDGAPTDLSGDKHSAKLSDYTSLADKISERFMLGGNVCTYICHV